MEQFLKSLAKLPYDKALHFVYGSVLFACLYHVFGTGNSLLAVMLVASGKEVYDLMHRDTHTPDFWDFVATFSGALVCASTLL